ncbi:unnamed protein product [Allacma fusca]|uniref:Mpv17-like protein n=1 Tax=Allacma fusca TaxID=39272 RepID=A0A8J2J6I1_9HEXA|nr:unnamed protein product [Allacma fusca]
MSLQVVRAWTVKYPISRGMVTYACLWPMANVTEQYLTGKKEIDLKQVLRFGVLGTFFFAPSLYIWVRISSRLIPGGASLRVGIKKALLEQITYSPYAVTAFLAGMGLLEGQSWSHIKCEWDQKFLPTWKTGACIWPIIQTVNFAFMKERNRVPFTAAFSFLWTVFLSFIKSQKVEIDENKLVEKK